jgi:PAS domain S-box-containing protein
VTQRGVKPRVGAADFLQVVESIAQAAGSIDSVRFVCLGISLYMAALHLTLARRGHHANAWVTVWALTTAFIQLTQIARSATPDDLVAAVIPARMASATVPVLVGSLALVVHGLTGRRLSRRALAAFAAFALAWAAVAIGTPAFIVGAPHPRAGPAMQLIGVMMAVAFVTMVRISRVLARRDRVILGGVLAAYVSATIFAVIHATVMPSAPYAWGLGTALAAVGLSHLVVGHERRLARIQAEHGMQELAASEARLRQLVEHAPVGIIACDATGQVRTVNPRLWDIFGAPEEVRRNPLGNLLEWNRRFGPRGPEQLKRTLQLGEMHTGEVTLAPVWGRQAQLRYLLTPLRTPDGSISGALVLAEDVTERNELERRLRLAQRMEAVGQLAAGIAHEINTPMAYVRTNLRALHVDWNSLREELRKDPQGEAAQELLGGAEALIGESLEGVERTIAIARDMREFAHSTSAAREPTDLDRELEACVRLATPQRAEIRIAESYGGVPAFSASASQLRQVFLNLIVNALQAVGPDGSVEVSSAVEGEFAVVRVRDDGCGIPENIQHRLFEPFFTTKPADQGTGLGLFISYEIVRAHGGEIRVQSAPGRGATFEVRLPLHPA